MAHFSSAKRKELSTPGKRASGIKGKSKHSQMKEQEFAPVKPALKEWQRDVL